MTGINSNLTRHFGDRQSGSALARSVAVSELPPRWPEDLQPAIRARVSAARQTIVVLDDDPTGTQTVYDTPVLTEWSLPVLRAEFQRRTPLVFILTNSRSETALRTRRIHQQIAQNLNAAREATGRSFSVISRSDSTLRGHFPVETDTLSNELGLEGAILLLIPFFAEGGRVTVNDVHYVVEGDRWTPVGETPFAQDRIFGFQASDLKDWVEERTGGRIRAGRVKSIDLTSIRTRGPAGLLQRFLDFDGGSVCVVNALDITDLEVVVAAMLEAEGHGRRFLCRTAASFVQARAGLSKRPLLDAAAFTPTESAGGLVVVGSHVPKTTEQLEHLLRCSPLKHLEIDVEQMRSETHATRQIDWARRKVEGQLADGRSCVVSTSREFLCGDSEEEHQRLGRTVAAGLAKLVRDLRVRPRFLIAKGGNTAQMIAREGLGIRRALVLGQLLPGVPVWRASFHATHPDRHFVVFPGNVGGTAALQEAVEILNPPRH